MLIIGESTSFLLKLKASLGCEEVEPQYSSTSERKGISISSTWMWRQEGDYDAGPQKIAEVEKMMRQRSAGQLHRIKIRLVALSDHSKRSKEKRVIDERKL